MRTDHGRERIRQSDACNGAHGGHVPTGSREALRRETRALLMACGGVVDLTPAGLQSLVDGHGVRAGDTEDLCDAARD